MLIRVATRKRIQEMKNHNNLTVTMTDRYKDLDDHSYCKHLFGKLVKVPKALYTDNGVKVKVEGEGARDEFVRLFSLRSRRVKFVEIYCELGNSIYKVF